MERDRSPFLDVPVDERLAENSWCFAILDAHPVSPGHTLVIPHRLITTWFEATGEEWRAGLDLVDVIRADLDRRLAPDGYNVGFNAGRAAGQTVFHAHLHVIPRFEGDVPDPAGGVRHAVMGRGHYDASSLGHPAES